MSFNKGKEFNNLHPLSSIALTLEQICLHLNLEFPSSEKNGQLFTNVTSLEEGTASEIACFHNKNYLKELQATKAGACLIHSAHAHLLPSTCIPLVVQHPYRAFAQLSQLFHPFSLRPAKEDARHLCHIHPSIQMGQGVILGAFTVIEEGVVLEDNVTIGSHCMIGKGCRIGAHSYLEDHVTLMHTTLGQKAYIQSGARIGLPGFGFDMTPQGPIDVPQLGRVVIRDDASIGANVCIDRGSLKDTVIGSGVRIDNLVQIGHNVVVGDNSVLVAQSGIAGSTELGKFVVVGGQVGIAGHLNIGDQVQIAGQSGVMRDIEPKTAVGGSPSLPIRDWHRTTVLLQKLGKEKG